MATSTKRKTYLIIYEIVMSNSTFWKSRDHYTCIRTQLKLNTNDLLSDSVVLCLLTIISSYLCIAVINNGEVLHLCDAGSKVKDGGKGVRMGGGFETK